MNTLLVVSKDDGVFQVIRQCLSSNHKVDKASSRDAALEMLQKRRFDFVFIDIKMLRELAPDNGYKTALQLFYQENPNTQIVIMSPQEMMRETVMAVKAGASNYLTYPINPEEVKLIRESIQESLKLESELNYLRDQFWKSESFEFVQTKSPLIKGVLEKIRSVAPTKSTVLLIGETGTGKGVLARLIHKDSNRRNDPFISVHCGAIPDTLLESELFGHEKGSFTGALRKKLGKFEIAKGGTIFLDEIGTITPSAQIKLLQILQDGTFERVGGEETIQADVRIISATNTDLKKMCDEGDFRRDLYFRLNVFPIEVPPLRERREDISSLVDAFLKKLNMFHSKEIKGVHPDVLEAFQNYPWPGNIRELENLIERAYIIETTSVLSPESFPKEIFQAEAPLATFPVNSSLTLSEARNKAIENIERGYLKELLAQNKGKINDSAKSAGITPRQLHKLMKKYDIRKEEFKLPK